MLKKSKQKNEKQSAKETPGEETAKESTSSSLLSKLKGLASATKQKFLSLPGWQRAVVVVVAVVVIAILAVIRPVKFAVLNVFMSPNVSITILESSTQQPVVGASVQLADRTEVTDENGIVEFADLKYGTYDLEITKEFYETTTDSGVVIDLGKTSFFLNVRATGIPARVEAYDWLSGEKITDFQVIGIDETSKYVSKEGVATVNLPNDQTIDSENPSFTLNADGYVDKTFTIVAIDESGNSVTDPNSEIEVTTVDMVQEGRHYFLSDREGTIKAYSSNLDGSDAQSSYDFDEESYVNLSKIPDESERYMYSIEVDSKYRKLGIFDLRKGTVNIFDEADNAVFRANSISKDFVIYTVRFDDSSQVKLKMYNYSTGKLTTIADTGANDTQYIDFYFIEDFQVILYTLKDGTNNKYEIKKYNINTGTVENLQSQLSISFHYFNPETDEVIIYISLHNGASGFTPYSYYGLNVVTNKFTKYDSYPEPPTAEKMKDSEKGVASPDGSKRVWVDVRDGRGRLIVNESSNSLQLVDENLSVNRIIRWFNDNTIIINGTSGTEQADFIIDINSGKSEKITNSFTNTGRGFH